MSKYSLKEIPTEELRKDLLDTMKDIRVCEQAIAIGLTQYVSKGGVHNDVVQRLEINGRIRDVIQEELASRE